MATRAKFQCYEIKTDEGGSNVMLRTVYSTKLGTEDNRFTKMTPSGTIEMRVDNPEAAVQFVPGKQYYVDFSEVPAEEKNK